MLRAAHYKADALEGPAAGKSPPKHRTGGILDLALTAADKYALSLLPTALKGTGLVTNDGPATDYRAVPQHPHNGIPPAYKMQRAAGNPLLHNSPSAASQDAFMQQSGVDSRVASSWDTSLKEILAALEPESRTLKPAKLRDHKYPNQNHGMPTNSVIPTPRRELDEALVTLPGGTRRGKSSVPAYAAAFKGLSRQSRRPEFLGNTHAGGHPSAVDMQYDMVPSVKLAWVGPAGGTYSTTGYGSSPKKYTSQLVGRVSPHYAGTPALQQSMSTPAGNQDPLHLPEIANGNGHATAGSFRGSNSVLPSYQTWAHSATPTPAASASHSTQARRALPYVSTNAPSLAKPLTVQYHPVLKSPSVGPGVGSLHGAQSGGSPASAWGSRGTPQRPATDHGSPHQAAGGAATVDPGRLYARNPNGTQPHRLPNTPPEVAAEVARLRHAQELDGVINGVRSDILQAAAPRLDAPVKSKFLQMYEDPNRPLAKLNPKQLLGDASQLSQQARRNRPPGIITERQPQSSTDGGPSSSSPSSTSAANRSPMYERRLRPLPSDSKSVPDAVISSPMCNGSDGGALVNVHLQPPELPGGDVYAEGGVLPELPEASASAEAASTGRSTPRSSQLEREDTALTDVDLPSTAAGDADADGAPGPYNGCEDAAGAREVEEAGVVADVQAEMEAEEPGVVIEARPEMTGVAADAEVVEQAGVTAGAAGFDPGVFAEAEQPLFAADVEAEQPRSVAEAQAEQPSIPAKPMRPRLAADALAEQTGLAAEAQAEQPAAPAEAEMEQPGPSTGAQAEPPGLATEAQAEASPHNGAPPVGTEERPLPSPTTNELQPDVAAGVLEGTRAPVEPSRQEFVRQFGQEAGPDSPTQQAAASQDGVQQDERVPELPSDAGHAACTISQGTASEGPASEPPAERAAPQWQAAGEARDVSEEPQQEQPYQEPGVSTEPEQSAQRPDGGTERLQQKEAAEDACSTGAAEQDALYGAARRSGDPEGTTSAPNAAEEDALAQQGSPDQVAKVVETDGRAKPDGDRPATVVNEPLDTAKAVTAPHPNSLVEGAADSDAPAVGVAGDESAAESPDELPQQLGAAPGEAAGPSDAGAVEVDTVATGIEVFPALLEAVESAAALGYSLPPGVTPELARASAVCIQSHARGYQARRRLAAMRKERDAASAPPPPTSPPLPPSSPARKQVPYELPQGVTPEMARAAVVRIQSHARGYFARRHVAELRKGREAGEAALATAVSAVALGKAEGFVLPPGITADQAEAAAIRVQAHMRGHLARRRVKLLRAERTAPPPLPNTSPAEIEAELAPPRASGEGAGGTRPADDDTALREAGEAMSTGAGVETAGPPVKAVPTEPEEMTIDALNAALADDDEEEHEEAGRSAQQGDAAAAEPVEPPTAAVGEPLFMSDPATVAAAAAAAAAAKGAATRVLDDGGAYGSDGAADTTTAADQAAEEASMARLAASSARTSAMFEGAGAEMRYSDDEASALELMDNLDGLLQGDDEAAAAAAAVAAATAPTDGEIVSISADGVSEPQSLGSGNTAGAANPMDVTEPGGVRVLASKYEVQHVVGEGAYGMVMKCKVRGTEPVQWVAIKEFKIDDNDPDAEDVKRTSLREVSVLEALQHPHVVGFVDKFMVGDRLFIVMEFLPCNLLELLEAQPGGMDRDAVRLIMFQLCSAIAFIHSKGMVYRDIKPENLLVDEHGTVKLCDFGFARYLPSGPKSHLTDYVATRWYRAPELLLGPPYRDALGKHVQYMYGPPVDMWAVGCLMGELLDGEPLFAGDSDLDQLYRVQQILGPMAPSHQYMFYANPHNTGIVFNIKQPVTLPTRYRGKVSDVELSFMAGLLEMDPDKRLTGEQCLQHPYLLDLAAAAQALPTPTPTDSNNPTNTMIGLESDASSGSGGATAAEAQAGDGKLLGAGKAVGGVDGAEADGPKRVSPFPLRLSDSREGLGSRGSEKAGSLTRAAGSLTRGGRSLSRGAISPVHPPVSSSPVPGSGPGPQRGGSKLLTSENGQVVIVEGVEEEAYDAQDGPRLEAATRLSTVKSVSALPIGEIEPAE